MSAHQPFPPVPPEEGSDSDALTLPAKSAPAAPEPQPAPAVPLPAYDPYAATALHQPPPAAATFWPPAPETNNSQQAGGFPPPFQPNRVPPPQSFGGPPAPGAPTAPPRKRRSGLLVLIAVVLLVALVGAVVGFVVLKKGGAASTPTCASLSGYTIFTSPDHSFCLAYPTGWRVANALQGSGAQFSGPAQQLFTVSNITNFSGTAADYDLRFCVNLDGTPSPTTTLTLSGHTWTQARCTFNAEKGRSLVEAIIYQGHLYHMDYGSSAVSFPSNRTQFFTPMEQSFRFLS